jgi:hypothetical protein
VPHVAAVVALDGLLNRIVRQLRVPRQRLGVLEVDEAVGPQELGLIRRRPPVGTGGLRGAEGRGGTTSWTTQRETLRVEGMYVGRAALLAVLFSLHSGSGSRLRYADAGGTLPSIRSPAKPNNPQGPRARRHAPSVGCASPDVPIGEKGAPNRISLRI